MHLRNLYIFSLLLYGTYLFTAEDSLKNPIPLRPHQLHNVKLSFGEPNIPGVTVLEDEESPPRKKSEARIDKEADVVRKLSPSPQPKGKCWGLCGKNNQVSKIGR